MRTSVKNAKYFFKIFLRLNFSVDHSMYICIYVNREYIFLYKYIDI